MRSSKIIVFSIITACLMSISSCSQSNTDNVPHTSALNVNTLPTYIPEKTLITNGVVVPELVSKLSFNSSGRIKYINAKIGSTVKTGDLVAQLDTAIQEADILRAEKNLQAAQLEYEYKKEKASDPKAKPADISDLQYNEKQAEIDLEKAKVELVIAQNALKNGSLISPLNGTVIELPANPGEIIFTGNLIMMVADLSHLKIETSDLNEMDISQVYVGQPVIVYIGALKTEVHGTVKNIASQIINSSESRRIKVTIGLDTQPDGLLWGMSTEIKFLLNQ